MGNRSSKDADARSARAVAWISIMAFWWLVSAGVLVDTWLESFGPEVFTRTCHLTVHHRSFAGPLIRIGGLILYHKCSIALVWTYCGAALLATRVAELIHGGGVSSRDGYS